MSVYSGFATRGQESQYDSILFNLLSLFSIRIVKFYNKENLDDEGFFKILNNYNRQLRKMEKQKYMQPKYSPILGNLLNKLVGDDGMSEKSMSTRQFPKIDKNLTVNVELYNKYLERDAVSEKTMSLDRIIERKVKKKKNKRKVKKDSADDIELWNQSPNRMPVIQRFKFVPQINTLQRSRYNWQSEMVKNVQMLKSGNINKVHIHQQNIKRITNGSKFRTKMYFK